MPDLPDDVVRFVAQHVDNLETLEILLLLRRQRPRELNAAEVTAELRLGSGSAAMHLADLAERGLLERRGERFRFLPCSAEDERVVGELARCYAERRVSLITTIFSGRSHALGDT